MNKAKKIAYKPLKPIMDREASSKDKLVIQELSGYVGHYGVYHVNDLMVVVPWNGHKSNVLVPVHDRLNKIGHYFYLRLN